MSDTQAEAIARYDALAGDCARMLEAARRGAWPEVADIEAHTRGLIAEIRARAAELPLDPPATRRKFRILRDILLIDAQIRHLADPRARRLDALLERTPAKAAGRRAAAERQGRA
jgi:flagellar protein FliT